MNRVYKDGKVLVYVIINPTKNISGGDTVFYEKVRQIDSVKRDYVLRHLHGRVILGPFDRCLNEGSL